MDNPISELWGAVSILKKRITIICLEKIFSRQGTSGSSRHHYCLFKAYRDDCFVAKGGSVINSEVARL